MSDAGNEKLRLEIELMTVQIDKGRVDIEKLQAEIRHMERWEPVKAIAAVIAAMAAGIAAIVGLAHLIR